MKVWITGAKGMLAYAIIQIIGDEYELLTTDKEIDITDLELVRRFFEKNKPEYIINCAAYTDVDGAEKNEELAFRINAFGPENLAKVSKEFDVPLLHFSTDYVFDGAKGDPYSEEDIPNPLQVYGRSKLAGEEAVRKETKKYYIIRTSWLFGPNGRNFVNTIINWARNNNELKVVVDQIGSPTYTFDLAQATRQIIAQRLAYGIYHIANRGSCSWYEFAKEIVHIIGSPCKVKPILTEQLHRHATRPKYSVLSTVKFRTAALGCDIRFWKDAVLSYIKTIDNGS